MDNWHIWTITVNRYKKVKEYIDKIPGIRDVLYPIAEKEYDTKYGIKRKRVSLYSNYLFIKYDHRDAEIVSMLEKCPWIHNYLGTCSQKEIKEVRKVDNTRYEDLMPISELQIGMQVKLIGTPFKDMVATLIGIDGNRLAISIKIFGAERIMKCSIDDIEMERGDGR